MRRNVRLRRPDSSTNTGTSDAGSEPSGDPCSGSSWTVTSPAARSSGSVPPGGSPQGSRRSLDRSFSERPFDTLAIARGPLSGGTSIKERYLPPSPDADVRGCPPTPARLWDAAPRTGTSWVDGAASGHFGWASSRQLLTCALPPTERFQVRYDPEHSRWNQAPTRLSRPIYPIALRPTNLAQAWAPCSRCVIYGEKSCSCPWLRIAPRWVTRTPFRHRDTGSRRTEGRCGPGDQPLSPQGWDGDTRARREEPGTPAQAWPEKPLERNTKYPFEPRSARTGHGRAVRTRRPDAPSGRAVQDRRASAPRGPARPAHAVRSASRAMSAA